MSFTDKLVVVSSKVKSPVLPWVFMLLGTVFIGLGIGAMIFSGLGVSPLDAFFASFSERFGLTTGSILIIFSLIFVAIAWVLGTKPGVGTIVSFIGIGLFVDLAIFVLSSLVPTLNIVFSAALWGFSFSVFALGVVLLFSSGLGASPYDQIVLAVSSRFKMSLGRSRIMFDFSAIVLAFLILGLAASSFIHVGTIIILLAVPLVLNKAVPVCKKMLDR